MTMSNFPDLLMSRLNSSLRVQCTVRANSTDSFSDLAIRSAEDDLRPPNGWELGVETIASKIFMEFNFDDSAKNLNSFYESRLIEVADSFWSTFQALKDDGFVIQIFSGSDQIEGPRETNIDSRVSIKCSYKTNLNDSELVANINEFLKPVIRFTSFCLMPLLPDADFLDGTIDEEGLPEGALTKILVNKYERNPKNRNACLAYYGCMCFVCGFDFGEVYGDFASNFIHVHHTTPVSKLGENYIVDPIKDLVPLCPNCHAAVHLNNPPIDPLILRDLMHERGNNG
jgi:5-methylcytosine-specific restriction protein A